MKLGQGQLFTLVTLWYVTDGHAEAEAMAPRLADPWYARNSRASISETLAALRRIGWAQRLLDPPSGDPPRQEVWADFLARVVRRSVIPASCRPAHTTGMASTAAPKGPKSSLARSQSSTQW